MLINLILKRGENLENWKIILTFVKRRERERERDKSTYEINEFSISARSEFKNRDLNWFYYCKEFVLNVDIKIKLI